VNNIHLNLLATKANQKTANLSLAASVIAIMLSSPKTQLDPACSDNQDDLFVLLVKLYSICDDKSILLNETQS
jgi:hypothetical protein